MAEAMSHDPQAEGPAEPKALIAVPPPSPPPPRPVWRLPTVLRYLVAAVVGMAVAGLASYLMRSIGF